ncbi:hypothetical protein AM1_5921 [Acaryochloris marina MBIC11017]|uniref:Uncharacterized protein n=1 Tax=Acaryochloris marina (strain MBIC 11017) TaxID=329726 RepID=B0C1M6_ACAM1|nr:hypothetical protein AM1_5921 [Acaryochloris marina MBIC11017]
MQDRHNLVTNTPLETYGLFTGKNGVDITFKLVYVMTILAQPLLHDDAVKR